jgi:hypothetical protein
MNKEYKIIKRITRHRETLMSEGEFQIQELKDDPTALSELHQRPYWLMPKRLHVSRTFRQMYCLFENCEIF